MTLSRSKLCFRFRFEHRILNSRVVLIYAVCSVFSFVLFSTSPRSFFRVNHIRKAWNKCSHSRFSSEVIILWFFYPNVGLCCCGQPWLLRRVKQWRDRGEKKLQEAFIGRCSSFDTIARTESSLKLFLSIFNLLNEHWHFNDAKLWPGRSLTRAVSAQSFKISCSSGNGFWLVYEDLSIDFGRTNFLQNRDMVCKLGCGLFLSPQQQTKRKQRKSYNLQNTTQSKLLKNTKQYLQ